MNLKDKIKDKVEIPVFKRCCCCLPLRYGLLAWGYFKIIVDICFLPIMAYYLVVVIFMIGMFGRTEHFGWILLYFALFIFAATTFMTDIIMSIVFVVGGHQKKVALLRVYYIYSIVMLILAILMATSSICLSLTNSFARKTSLRSWDILLVVFSAYFVIIIVQSYFMLLLRSEIIKLRNNAESFRFVNNAAEAECTMIYKENLDISLPSPETETEVV